MSDMYFDPSDSVDIPDDAEPWDNRPDAVRDLALDDVVAAVVSDSVVPWILQRWGEDLAVLIAHQILNEVEARRGRTG